jgi:gamma-polyglutamate biosynthesis protein CapA
MRKFYFILLLLTILLGGMYFYAGGEQSGHVVNIANIPLVPVFQKKSVSIINFGDVMFDRGVRNVMSKGRDPFEYIKKDKNVLEKYDVVIANLEGPIVEMDRKKCQQKAYNFQFASTTTDLLKSVGINMVNIANNHNYDCYKVGFESTKNYLAGSGIEYIGDTELEKSYLIKEINGKKVAFVGMDETIQPIPLYNFYPLIKQLDSEVDFIIVNIHWGTEYSLEATQKQKNIAHALVDNGVDVIFGHHPHVIEPLEIYKEKAIFYSLGNFVFDQTDPVTLDGLGVGVTFENETATFELFPFHLNQFAPTFLKDPQKTVFCEKYLKSLDHMGCTFEIL